MASAGHKTKFEACEVSQRPLPCFSSKMDFKMWLNMGKLTNQSIPLDMVSMISKGDCLIHFMLTSLLGYNPLYYC
jgi:hypothetical protein